MVSGENVGAGCAGQSIDQDYIRVYLGLMGSGKTHLALTELASHPRLIVYSPGISNPLMRDFEYIYDTDEYLNRLGDYLTQHPRIRIEKKASPSNAFQVFQRVQGYTFLFDDIAVLKTNAQERTDFEAFARTVRFNGNKIVITTHRARRDIPPSVLNIGTSFYYIGPGHRGRRELETLYELVNYPISFDEFVAGVTTNRPRSESAPAGVFKIRGV